MKKMTKKYRLYIWQFVRDGMFRSDYKRGKCIGTFSRYKDLVAEAERRAVAAGYPKSRWYDLFDWNV